MMVSAGLPVPLVTGFPPPQKAHPHSGTERRTLYPASSGRISLRPPYHLSSCAGMISYKGRYMEDGRLSGANDLYGGVFRRRCRTGYDPATRASRPLLYAIQGGHLVYTSVGHNYKPYGHSVEKPRIQPDFLRKRSIHSDVSLFTSIDYEEEHPCTNNLPLLRPLPTPLPNCIDRAGVHSSFGGCIGRTRDISVLLS